MILYNEFLVEAEVIEDLRHSPAHAFIIWCADLSRFLGEYPAFPAASVALLLVASAEMKRVCRMVSGGFFRMSSLGGVGRVLMRDFRRRLLSDFFAAMIR